MKNITTYLLPLLLTVLTGCQNLLDKEPQNKISLEETFQDFEAAKVAMTGAYGSLFETAYLNGNRLLYPDIAGGNVKYARISNVALSDVYFFAADPDAGDMNNTYTQLYAILNNLNNIISNVPAISNGTEKTKNRLVAEATALRAMIHFDLLLLYAQPYQYTADASHPGIVLNLKPILLAESIRARSTVAACYDAIVNDLNEAITLFDNSTPVFTAGNAKNYMNPASVKALLARVYLQKGSWQLAHNYADEVIKSGSFKLYSNAEYVNAWTQKNTSEAIFEVSVPNATSGTSLGSYFDITTVNASPSTLQMAATNDLLDLYTTTDVRNRDSFYAKQTIDGTSFSFCKKYPTGGTLATGIKVLRISEMFLIRAEAAAELGNLTQANLDLNTIAQRADPKAASENSADKQTVINRILLERRKELNYEGFLLFDLSRRKQDLTRTDCSAPTCSFKYPSPYYILPLPAATVLVNPMISQNPGY
ncbi:RagB/SusD family nutrient uptake outer membrane protein [Dyadobacter diqingensis]|uniref:RagB/SusD family nutrient uptake outer membrane protein n=1 Tax=Dyadobacter diqingensis TaxID=2938121 RepID=UPI0020C1AAE1|nr:RagB/SusD family nutrient uptake outer membrane protein [Dyadobacter diqingensis]